MLSWHAPKGVLKTSAPTCPRPACEVFELCRREHMQNLTIGRSCARVRNAPTESIEKRLPSAVSARACVCACLRYREFNTIVLVLKLNDNSHLAVLLSASTLQDEILPRLRW